LVEVYTAIGELLDKKTGRSDQVQEVLASPQLWHLMCSSVLAPVVHYKKHS